MARATVRRPRTLLFEADGVVVDSEDDWYRAEHEELREELLDRLGGA